MILPIQTSPWFDSELFFICDLCILVNCIDLCLIQGMAFSAWLTDEMVAMATTGGKN